MSFINYSQVQTTPRISASVIGKISNFSTEYERDLVLCERDLNVEKPESFLKEH